MNKNDKTVEMKKVNPTPASQKKKKKKFSPQRVVAVIMGSIATLGCVALIIVSAITIPIINKAPHMTTADFTTPASTEMVDRNGVEFHTSGYKLRDNISYDDLSPNLIDAFVSAEDSRFFQHNGFDVPRFTKAMMNNVLNTLKRGRFVFGEGGSTFTMQLIKNTLYVNDGSDGGEITQAEGGFGGISRKINEIYLSQKLEANKTLNKKLILELYLNRIDFGVGNNVVGIENSARAYFGKSAAELNTVESAFMAGVINAPFANSPYYSIKRANEATQRVLYNMHYHGYISAEEYNLVKNVKIEDLLVANNTAGTKSLAYQAYVDAVYEEVQKITKMDASKIPMKITTAINLDVQSGLDKAQHREVDYVNIRSTIKDSNVQAASAVVDNKTGEIVGMFGRYDYDRQRITNLAYSNPVQPGSTLKPVVSYAPAYEYLGWASSHIITDEPISLDGLNNTNYDNRFLGQITLNTAVGDSRNIPAIKTFMEIRDKISDSKYIDYLASLNLTKNAPNFGWGYAIGNDPFKVEPVNIAGATSMILNGGQYTKPHTVLRIEFKDGREPIVPTYETQQILSPGAAYLASRDMKYVVDSGINAYTNPLRRSYPVFGKTGTVQWDDTSGEPLKIPKGAQKDRLMTAGTDRFTINTWTGFEINGPKSFFSSGEASFNLAGKLNNYILGLLEKSYGNGKDFALPDDLTQITHITGPFPYQAPLDGMNPSLISKGYILKKHAKLVDATPQTLQALGSQKVSVDGGTNAKLNIHVDLAKYPDESKLSIASDVLEMVNGKGVKFTGKRLFDESWIYGAVRYKTDVRVNGQTVAETVQETNQYTLSLDHPKGVDTLEICSYYTFDKAPTIKSAAVCEKVAIDAVEDVVNVPQFSNRSVLELLNFTSSHQMPNPTISYDKSGQGAFGRLIEIKPDISGKKMRESELRATALSVKVSDANVGAGSTVSDFVKRYGNTLSITNTDLASQGNQRIDSFTIRGKNVTSFWISDALNVDITLNLAN